MTPSSSSLGSTLNTSAPAASTSSPIPASLSVASSFLILAALALGPNMDSSSSFSAEEAAAALRLRFLVGVSPLALLVPTLVAEPLVVGALALVDLAAEVGVDLVGVSPLAVEGGPSVVRLMFWNF